MDWDCVRHGKASETLTPAAGDSSGILIHLLLSAKRKWDLPDFPGGGTRLENPAGSGMERNKMFLIIHVSLGLAGDPIRFFHVNLKLLMGNIGKKHPTRAPHEARG